MRTTLTLEDNLAEKLKKIAHRRRVSFKQIVDETLRAGLAAEGKPIQPPRRFQVEPAHCGFVPGVDIGKLNQLSDDLEALDMVDEGRAR